MRMSSKFALAEPLFEMTKFPKRWLWRLGAAAAVLFLAKFDNAITHEYSETRIHRLESIANSLIKVPLPLKE